MYIYIYIYIYIIYTNATPGNYFAFPGARQLRRHCFAQPAATADRMIMSSSSAPKIWQSPNNNALR